MTKAIQVLRIIFQIAFVSVFLFAAFILIEFRIPGHHSFTDNDSGVFAILYLVLLSTGLLLLVNSVFFLIKKHWLIYRRSIIALVILCAVLVFIPRSFINWFFLGEKVDEYQIVQNEEFLWVRLKLYNNGKFLRSTSDGGEFTYEDLGTYNFDKDSLTLEFEDEFPADKMKFHETLYQNLGSEYEIKRDTLYCLNCSIKQRLAKVRKSKK